MSSGACMTGAFPACPLNRCLGSCQKVLPTRHATQQAKRVFWLGPEVPRKVLNGAPSSKRLSSKCDMRDAVRGLSGRAEQSGSAV